MGWPGFAEISFSREFVAGCLLSGKFAQLTTLVICSNIIFMGFQTDFSARHLNATPPTSYLIIDLAFCCMFALEIVMRVYAFGSDFFIHQDYWWQNWFDLVMVIQQASCLLCAIVDDTHVASALAITWLRIFRLARIARLGRMLTAISELKLLVVSIGNSVGAVLLTLVFISFLTYAFALFCVQVATDRRRVEMTLGLDPDPRLVTLYGSLPHTMLLLYCSISSGTACLDLLAPFMDSVSMQFAYVLYTGFVTFCMMNVLTSTFVEQNSQAVRALRVFQLQTNLEDAFKDEDDDLLDLVIDRDIWYEKIGQQEMSSY